MALALAGAVGWGTPLLTPAAAQADSPPNDKTLLHAGYGYDMEARVRWNAGQVRNGDVLTLETDLSLKFGWKDEDLERVEGIYLVFAGERLYDEKGDPHLMSNIFMSTHLTPTGIPIENSQLVLPSATMGNSYTTPFDLVAYHPLPEASLKSREFRCRQLFQQAIGEEVPPGHYRLWFQVFLKVGRAKIPIESYQLLNQQFFTYSVSMFELADLVLRESIWKLLPNFYLPVIRVGEPAPPEMIWTLFSEINSLGLRGIVAEEDRGRFQLHNRRRFPAEFILPPGSYRLEPDFPTYFVTEAGSDTCAGLVLPRTRDHGLDFASGEMSVVVEHPDGRRVDLGSAPFRGRRKAMPPRRLEVPMEYGFGATTSEPRFDYRFDEWGRYRVTMKGWILDEQGNRYKGGGTYSVWIALPMSFSTSAKPGTPFFTGQSYPANVHVNPPFPAEVEIVVDYLPNSDPARKLRFGSKGRANRYGHYESATQTQAMTFAEPGEYRAELSARYRDPRGVLWIGNQVGAGVVADARGDTLAHGLPYPVGPLTFPDPGYEANFNLRHESLTPLLLNVCDGWLEFSPPYHAGDVLFMTTKEAEDNIASDLTFETRDQRVTDRLLDYFPNGGWSVFSYFLDREARHGLGNPYLERIVPLQLLSYLPNAVFSPRALPRMLPLLFQTDNHLHPFAFPEHISVESYSYFAAIRPGLSPHVMVADSTAFAPYWELSPNEFGSQFNTGLRGDMPLDIYRFLGGVVYRDLRSGDNKYAAYAAMGIMLPQGHFASRISAPMSEPLLNVNGRDFYLFLAQDAGTVYETGESARFGCAVFPPVPAEVEYTVTKPDGESWRCGGTANPIGNFACKERLSLDQPGLYLVKSVGRYQGRQGDVLGTPDGAFHLYVADSRPAQRLEVGVRPGTDIPWDRPFPIPLQAPPDLREVRIHYTLVVPGYVIDQGELPTAGNRASFRLFLEDLRLQFPNIDYDLNVADRNRDERVVADSLFFVFFMEGVTAQGEEVHDARLLMIRRSRAQLF